MYRDVYCWLVIHYKIGMINGYTLRKIFHLNPGMRIKVVSGIILSLFFLSLTSFAQEQKRTYQTQRLSGDAPVIDGVMDDSSWEQVEWGDEFTQSQPYDGRSPSQPTYFKILYDDDNLYIGVLSYDSVPGKIYKRMSRRDSFDGDRITVIIDSYFDHLTAFAFTVNAVGVKGDEYVTDDGRCWDETWDPIWYAKTTIHDTGWTAEIQIPYTQLRFGNRNEHVWGLQVIRMIFRNDEWNQWQYIPQDASGWVHNFGELHGINGIHPKRQVDFFPYIVTKAETFEKEEGNPYTEKGKDAAVSAGLDAKIGLTNDLTLDLTVNPDFGQVEADPSEVNLTAFETFFQEKRPFFIEGNNIINFQFTSGGNPYSGDNLFYSRRIGRQPRHYPDVDDEEFVDSPDNTTILGAFKITGKTQSGWSVGLLESVTQQENAEISGGEGTRKEEVEPLTNYFTGRLQKDINKGNTIIGGMMTAINRKITNPAIDYIPDAAYSAGVDFQQYWKDKTYFLRFKGAFSYVKGDTIAITNIQLSPVHYFQRPDATYLKLDSTKTFLSGHGGSIEFGKFGKGHVNMMGFVTWRSPGLDMNDIGYLRSGDEVFQVFWIQYRIWEPFGIFRSMRFNANQWSGWDFGGRRTFYGGNINLNTQFNNHWSFGTGFNYEGSGLDKGSLRGGPSFKYPASKNVWFYAESDERKKFIFEISHSRSWSTVSDELHQNYSLDLTYRPMDALKLSLSPFFSKDYSRTQYVETAEYDGVDRYIVSNLDQNTFGIVARIDYAITPDLTIQYYGQPFTSAGDYTEFKRITDPQADNYFDRFHIFSDEEISYNPDDDVYYIDENNNGTVDYEFENPNFNFIQFRSNMVLRWEYIPGSVLYLVWSQDRTDLNDVGVFDYNRDVNHLFSITPHNIFLLKVSYRIKI